ncbi:ABC transporter permease [Clostridium sp. AN503]|uniref:ABC transporter permease n=1 Tax=Clostridium sp. AN503 TaxID=3160598 RepID=UPI00345783FB
MYKYIIKRLGMVILVVLAVSFAVFFIMDMVPGDPAVTALGDEATAEALAYYRETHGLNDPLIVQYVRYMSGILRRDLGTSIYNGADVWQLYFSKLPYTINLACCSALLAVLCSIPLGMAAAIKRNTWIDAIASMIAFVGLAMPNFWIGILLILAFSVNMSIFPSFGAGDGLRSLVLPSITCGTAMMAAITRTTRSAMLDVINQDYLRTARSKGLPEKVVMVRHALKNALIPIVTMVGTQIAGLIGGSVVTERVFSWPGVGSYIVDSILKNDYQVVTGFVIMTSIMVSLILLCVDLLYAFIDPRIKAQFTK